MGVSGGERHSQWVSRVASDTANGPLVGSFVVFTFTLKITLAILVEPYKERILWLKFSELLKDFLCVHVTGIYMSIYEHDNFITYTC